MTADPTAIAAEMAETRADLARKLGALKDRVFGSPPAPAETRIMARKKAQSEASDKKTRPESADKKTRSEHDTKKTKSEGTAKKKTSAKKAVTARATSRTTAGSHKKSAPAKTSPKRPSTSRRGKDHESTLEKVETKATEVLGDMLAGAAAGALRGAAEAAAPHVESAVGEMQEMGGIEQMAGCENRGREKQESRSGERQGSEAGR